MSGLIEGGSDIILIETIFDTLNAKAAGLATLEVFDETGVELPIMISGTITDRSGRTLSGQTAEAFWYSMRHLRPFSIGLNCALGAELMRPYIAELSHVADVRISAYPNAGLPNAMGEYDETPDDMACAIEPWAARWARQHRRRLLRFDAGSHPAHRRACGGLTSRGRFRRSPPRCASPASNPSCTGDRMTAMKFEDQKLPDLDHYVTLAEQSIPARRAIFAIVEASFLELLPLGPARILVVGAGGGEEIVRLGQDNPTWSFVGVDTYEPMVELARRRLAELPSVREARFTRSRSRASTRRISTPRLAFSPHTSFPTTGRNWRSLKAIRARLKPGAPLAIIDGVGIAGEPETELLRRIWKRHAVRNGAAEELAENNAENFKKVAVVSAEREEELLTSAGFERLTPIFRGLAIKGWLAFA